MSGYSARLWLHYFFLMKANTIWGSCLIEEKNWEKEINEGFVTTVAFAAAQYSACQSEAFSELRWEFDL